MASKLYKKIVRAYNAGEVIFNQGDDSDSIYSVQVGRVTVYKTKPGSKGPIEVEIAKLGPGGMFGEMAMLDKGRRDATVKALEYTELLVISRDMFDSQMAALPPWVLNFIKIIISRLRLTNDKLFAAMQHPENPAGQGQADVAAESIIPVVVIPALPGEPAPAAGPA